MKASLAGFWGLEALGFGEGRTGFYNKGPSTRRCKILGLHTIQVKLAGDSKWGVRTVPQRLMSLGEAEQKCRQLNREGRLLGLRYRIRPRF